MPSPSWYPHNGVCATAVTSLVGFVQPNIQMSCRKKVGGNGPLSFLTVASTGSSPWPSLRYRSCSTWSCSSAKNSMARTERKANLDCFGVTLVCVYGPQGARFYSWLCEVWWLTPTQIGPGKFVEPWWPGSVVPTIAMSRPVPIGLILWWCASLSNSW